jgi:hypothetical protein
MSTIDCTAAFYPEMASSQAPHFPSVNWVEKTWGALLETCPVQTAVCPPTLGLARHSSFTHTPSPLGDPRTPGTGPAELPAEGRGDQPKGEETSGG